MRAEHYFWVQFRYNCPVKHSNTYNVRIVAYDVEDLRSQYPLVLPCSTCRASPQPKQATNPQEAWVDVSPHELTKEQFDELVDIPILPRPS